MPPKQEMSKKNKQKKQAAALEAQTFGLKNKNKSAKVQNFIAQATKASQNNSIDKNAARRKEERENMKLVKKLQDEEMNALLNEGITQHYGKNKKKQAEKAATLIDASSSEELRKELEEKGLISDGDDSDESDYEGSTPTYTLREERVEVEIFREKTAEDYIEEQRAKFLAEGKVGTPVTEATFLVWRTAKLKKRQEEAEARALAELSKKKGSKGLSVLSGKELFNFNASLFIDDETAIDAAQEVRMLKT